MIETLISYLRDPSLLIAAAGYYGLTAIVFAETGLLFGFVLPGDSLLVAAGLYCAKGFLDVWKLGALLSVAAIVGDTVGYAIGRKLGPALYNRPDSFFFRKSHLLKAKSFYETHGGKAIVMARFVPIVRTFAPTVAGIAEMKYAQFVLYNILGGLFWIWSLLLGGYYLARSIPNINDYIHLIVVGILVVSALPIAYEYFKSRR